jgi:hypothetical protein
MPAVLNAKEFLYTEKKLNFMAAPVCLSALGLVPAG